MLTRTHSSISLAALTLVLGSFVGTPPAMAQEFSARVVRTPSNVDANRQIFVGKSKVRFHESENGQSQGSAIFDFTTNAMTIVDDQDHIYIGGGNDPVLNAAMAAIGSPPLWRFFRPQNSSDPCAEWNSIAAQFAPQGTTEPPPHYTCRSLGKDTVNGRAANKWAVTGTSGNETGTGLVWIDSRLHVVSRSQDESGDMQLKDVQEGPQPDSVFAIPADYQQVSMTDALARLQSGQGGGSGVAEALAKAADALKGVGNEAAVETANETKQQAKGGLKKKLRGLIHLP